MHVYVFLFQPIFCSVTFLRFNAHACMYMSTMSCLSTWRNCARIRIYACRSRLERRTQYTLCKLFFPMIAEVKVLQQQNVVYVHFMCMLPCWLFKWNYGQHRCGYTFIPTGNRFSARECTFKEIHILLWVGENNWQHIKQAIYHVSVCHGLKERDIPIVSSLFVVNLRLYFRMAKDRCLWCGSMLHR